MFKTNNNEKTQENQLLGGCVCLNVCELAGEIDYLSRPYRRPAAATRCGIQRALSTNSNNTCGSNGLRR